MVFDDLLIPACLLGMYLPMLGLAGWGLFKKAPRLLKRLHLGAWALTLLQLVLYLKWGLSLRGQWADVLPFGAAWAMAGGYFIRQRTQLGWAGRLYFGGWFFYPLALVGAFALDRIFFVLVSLPLVAFLPAATYFSSPAYVIRGGTGLMGAPRAALVAPVGLVFERHLGTTRDVDFLADSILSVTLKPAVRPAATEVVVTTSRGTQPVVFTARDQ